MLELEEAVNQLKDNKAPRPDEFTTNFSHTYWDTIKDEVLVLMENWRKTCDLLKSFNSTFIALIPKEHDVDIPSSFLPISLYNVVFKIITRSIANRLKLLLPDLISKE